MDNVIFKEAEALQDEMHSYIEEIKQTERGKKLSYEDLVIVYFLYKISELQSQLDKKIEITEQ